MTTHRCSKFDKSSSSFCNVFNWFFNKIFTKIVTIRIAKIITKGWLGFVQVNGTSEERLLAQLSALQLAVSQGSTNTVMVFLQFLLIFILIYIWWWLGVFAILVIVMMMMVFTRWQRHAGTAHRLWGSRPWSSTERADCSCSGCQFGQGGGNIWWRRYLVEKIFDWEIIWWSWRKSENQLWDVAFDVSRLIWWGSCWGRWWSRRVWWGTSTPTLWTMQAGQT